MSDSELTDKIVLTKKQFMKWSASETPEADWYDLVFESQRPELIERWAVVGKRDDTFLTFKTKNDAEDYMKRCNPIYKLVLLREVEGGE